MEPDGASVTALPLQDSNDADADDDHRFRRDGLMYSRDRSFSNGGRRRQNRTRPYEGATPRLDRWRDQEAQRRRTVPPSHAPAFFQDVGTDGFHGTPTDASAAIFSRSARTSRRRRQSATYASRFTTMDPVAITMTRTETVIAQPCGGAVISPLAKPHQVALEYDADELQGSQRL
jgi:hypothetical protein